MSDGPPDILASIGLGNSPSVVSPFDEMSETGQFSDANGASQPTGSRTAHFGDIHPAEGNAKDILHKRFQQGNIPGFKAVNHQIPKNNFVTFRKPGTLSHNTLWSCAFVCPVSAEVFLSGRLFTHARECTMERGVHWYGTAKEAKLAAAGRAEDCFRFRGEESPHQFCVEAVYVYKEWSVRAGHPGIPPETANGIDRLVLSVYSRMGD